MRTKQSGLSIIDCRYRLLASRRIAEEFINLAHGVRVGWLWSHTFQDTLRSEQSCGRIVAYFYDPVVLAARV